MDDLDLTTFPTEFRGCRFDAGWEFDSPAVVYYPSSHRNVSENGRVDSLIEDICISISMGDDSQDGIDEFMDQCENRGWGPRGFAKRKRAWHMLVIVTWKFGEDGNPEFEYQRIEEWNGPIGVGKLVRRMVDGQWTEGCTNPEPTP